MRIVRELFVVILTGVIGFLGTIAYVLGAIFIWLCATIAAVCMIVVLFCLGGWLLLDSRDAFLTMLNFLAYGTAAFTIVVAGFYYRDKLTDWLVTTRRPNRRIGRYTGQEVKPEDEPFIAAPQFELRVTPPHRR